MKTTCYKRRQNVKKTAVVNVFCHISEDFLRPFFVLDSYAQITSIVELFYYEVGTFGGTSRKSTS